MTVKVSQASYLTAWFYDAEINIIVPVNIMEYYSQTLDQADTLY